MSDGTKPLVPPALYAFPFSIVVPTSTGTQHDLCPGMTHRDYLAASAMQGLYSADPDRDHDWVAENAYRAADAMLRARKGGG